VTKKLAVRSVVRRLHDSEWKVFFKKAVHIVQMKGLQVIYMSVAVAALWAIVGPCTLSKYLAPFLLCYNVKML